jgi:hypothetical protein
VTVASRYPYLANGHDYPFDRLLTSTFAYPSVACAS